MNGRDDRDDRDRGKGGMERKINGGKGKGQEGGIFEMG